MRRYLRISLFAVVLLLGLFGQVACASGERLNDVQTMLQWEQISFANEKTRANVLNKVFYISDNEIWFNFLTDKGNGKLLCYNLKGDLIETLDIYLMGEDPSVLCVNQVGNKLMVGYQDDSTNRAEIIILDSHRKVVARKSFGKEVYTIQMVASERGILYAGGIDTKDGMSVFYLSEIDADGKEIFDYKESVGTLDADHGYVGSSIIASDGDHHYAIIKNGVIGSLHLEERLVCFNAIGEKLWETDLSESFYSNDMAISDGHIYIVGADGMRDEYGCLVNQNGAVLCYSQSNGLLWQQHCSSVEYFYFVVPSEKGCYAISNIIESQAYMLWANDEIITQKAEQLKLPTNAVYSSFSLTDTSQLSVVGKTTDALFIGVLEK